MFRAAVRLLAGKLVFFAGKKTKNKKATYLVPTEQTHPQGGKTFEKDGATSLPCPGRNNIPNCGQIFSKAVQSKAKKNPAVECAFVLAGARQVLLALSCPCKMPVQELLLPSPAAGKMPRPGGAGTGMGSPGEQ